MKDSQSIPPPVISRKAPEPHGLLTGKRHTWRRYLSLLSAFVNRAFDTLPPGRWLHRYAHRDLLFPELEMPLSRGGAGLNGLRIAFLSDIHAGSYMNEKDLCRIFSKVNEQQPDLICMGGDLINTREREVLMFREPLKLVDPPLGIFCVPGNHDHFWGEDLGLWSSFLKDQGVHILHNEGVRVTRSGSSVWLAGVDDLTEGKPDLQSALHGSLPNEPTILLSHHPDFFFEAAAVGVDLTLSGHTHGGQIAPFGKVLLSHSQFAYNSGWFRENDSRLFVGKGVGVSLLPLRIGAPAEVPMVTLQVSSS